MKIEALAAQKGYKVTDGTVTNRNGKKLRPAPDSKGYLRFNVATESGQMTCWVHRLVAFQKFGDAIYAEGTDVRHIDGNHQNNCDSNILIGTRSENLRDTPKERRSERAVATNQKKHAELRGQIQSVLDQGHSVRRTAELVGCSPSAVMAQKTRTGKGR